MPYRTVMPELSAMAVGNGTIVIVVSADEFLHRRQHLLRSTSSNGRRVASRPLLMADGRTSAGTRGTKFEQQRAQAHVSYRKEFGPIGPRKPDPIFPTGIGVGSQVPSESFKLCSSLERVH
jgi:hypothetical protein